MPETQREAREPTPQQAVREINREAREEGADLYDVEDLAGGAGGFASTPEEMVGALHMAGLWKSGKRATRAAAEEALRIFRTAPVTS